MKWFRPWVFEARAARLVEMIREGREQQRMLAAARAHNERTTDAILRELEDERA